MPQTAKKPAYPVDAPLRKYLAALGARGGTTRIVQGIDLVYRSGRPA